MGNNPVHDNLYPLADPAGGLRLAGPDGRQNFYGVGGANGVNRLVPDQREGVSLKRRLPLGRVFWVAPGGATQFDHPGGGFCKGGDGWSLPTGCFPLLAFLGYWVPAFSDRGAILLGHGPGSGKADGGIRPQTDVPAPSTDYDSLDP